VQHGHNEIAKGNQHIIGIESFWSYAKRRMVKFNGVSRGTFFLHLKETEFCFNHRHENLYKVLLKMLSKQPLC
jgi:transposase